MGGNNFELLMEEIFNQKQLMDELVAENQHLRRQLTDLREGRGIILEIQGQLFTLADEAAAQMPEADLIAQNSPMPPMPIMEQATTVMATSQTTPREQPTTAISIPSEAPMPNTDQFEQMTQSFYTEEEVSATSSTFLEDMLVDEFASAATSPMSVWQGSKTRKLAMIDEEEKAELRKELIGSFLLE